MDDIELRSDWIKGTMKYQTRGYTADFKYPVVKRVKSGYWGRFSELKAIESRRDATRVAM